MKAMKKINNFHKKPKKEIKELVFSICFFALILFLKTRAGITYKESRLITKFYFSAAIYRKQYLNAIKVFFLLFFKVSWKEFFPDYDLFDKKYYKTEKNTWQIGQWYSINPEILKEITPKADAKNVKLFSIGREAIAHVLKSNKFNKKVAVLPVFTCFTVLDPFIQDGWEIYFYRYNKDLSVDIEYFLEIFQKVQPSVCVFQPLSGMGFMDKENELIDMAYNNGCMTVVDQTQDVYNDKNHPSVDYYCGSLRKWYSFPDGSFLYSPKYDIAEPEVHNENRIYRTSMGLCMFAKHLSSVYNEPFFAYLYNFMWTFSVSYIGNTKIVSHTMSDYSRRVLALQDEDFNSKTRIDNFNYIYERIKNLKKVRPAFENIERLTSVPLSFPIYAEKRRELVPFLSSRGVGTQLLWSRPPYVRRNVKLDETTEYIYDHILSLPCDQRYTLEDMQRMADIICEYDQKV